MKWLLALLALTVCAPCAFADQSSSQALETLLKALSSQRDVKATLIQCRTDGVQRITVNVKIAPNVGIAAKVTTPLIYAGMVSFDDGEYWRNYDPQIDLLRIEKSPAKFHLDVGLRKKLIDQNYVVTIQKGSYVAGRRTAVVSLRAKLKEVSDRTLYIDASNSLILRYIVTDADGNSVTTVDTHSVDVNSAVDVAAWARIGEGASKVEKSWGPIELSKIDDAKSYVGFVPNVPSSLPAGLARQAIHVVGTRERSFIGVRLTDGMALVTVYMWRSVEGEKPQDEPFEGKYDAKSSSGTRVKVVGDASTAIKEALARMFASS